ncbi:MAG: hypothetical protein KGL39_04925 [Patescibacteria group bacterium]|nr:hypothetical protein [Patescibacteria group bacterium]
MSLSHLRPLADLTPDAEAMPPAAEVDAPETTTIIVDPDTGAVTTESDDGGSVVDFDPQAKRADTTVSDHFANLAEHVGDDKLSALASRLLEDIEAANQSRQKWLDTRTKGLTLMALEISPPRGDAGASAAPLEGMSSVRHPLMLEAVIRGASTASGELLPTDGPVKIRNDGVSTGDTEDFAEALEKDFNHYLTTTAREYYPDTDRMLLHTYFGGTEFKKVYICPIRRRPVSDWVSADKIIVPQTAQDLHTSDLIAHEILMRKSTMRRMQLLKVYRDVPLQTPVEDPNPVQRKEKAISGQSPNPPDKPEANRYTVYETYCEALPSEVGIDEPDAPTGLPLPYKITVEKDSRKILEIKRNWKEDDTNYDAIQWFVKFSFVPGFGFYDIGLVDILGGATEALTAAWRIALDSGMFANFPGFLYAKSAGRQVTNEFRIPPGGGMAIDTGGQPLNAAIQPLPYKDVTAGMLNMITHVEEVGQRLGGTADIQVGEGRQDAPVGTTIAMIEQATKVLDEVHKRLHRAQATEFQLLKERFKEDPEAFWRNNSCPAMQWNAEKFLMALQSCALVPMADPNASSHIHRLMKAMALTQLVQMSNGQGWNVPNVQKRVLKTLGFDDSDELTAPIQPPPAPPPDPKAALAAAQLQQKQQQTQQDNQRDAAQDQFRAHEVALESQDRAADRASREKIAAIKLEGDKAKLAQKDAENVRGHVMDGLTMLQQPKGTELPQ